MWIVSILILLLILTVVVVIHEFGHFIVAKKSGVHIYEFAIGMGPVIFKKIGKDGIKYSIRAFPIGGFVQMAGEVGEDDEGIKKNAFMCNKKAWQRFLILIAGVFNNFVTAILLLFIMSMIWGSQPLTNEIGVVAEGYPIADAGIEIGDKLVEINGHKVSNWDDAQIYLQFKHEGEYEFKVEKPDGEVKTYKIEPKIEEDAEGNERKVFGLGISPEVEKGFTSSIKYAFGKTVSWCKSMFVVIGNLITGKLSLGVLAGPVGMFSVVDAGVSGVGFVAGLQNVLFLIAYISVNLAVINVLPFPAFDGGRILFLAIEKIKGSPINSKVENIIHNVGFWLLMVLIIYIAIQDIIRLF